MLSVNDIPIFDGFSRNFAMDFDLPSKLLVSGLYERIFLMASKSILLPIDNGFILITPEAVLGMYFGKLEWRDLINQIEPTIAITATEMMIVIFFEFIDYKDAKN